MEVVIISHQEKINKRKLSLITKAWVILICFVTIFLLGSNSYAYSISSTKRRLKKTRKSLRAARKNFKKSKIRKKDIARQLYRTQKNIRILNHGISKLNRKIRISCSDIRKLRKDLDKTEKLYQKNQVKLQSRLSSIYLNSDDSFLNVLAGSQSFAEFSNDSEFLGKLCSEDEKLINTLRIQRESICSKKVKIRNKYKKMLSYRGRLKMKRRSLENIEEERENLLEEAKKECQYYLERKCKLEDHTAELERDIQKMLRSYHHRRSYGNRSYRCPKSTGSYGWPCNGVITSGYGYRVHPIFGTRRFHTGVDIGAYSGTPIRAADGGTVIYSGWCGGYGYTVMVSHGRGTVTLYGHCSRLYVRYGQTVSKGQRIAAVGSTGNSTGPHLHFEVRQNGSPVNPYGYLRR